jgi:hypothetical protein
MPNQSIREANGFLFIGDPHLSSRRPGRRKDAEFGQTVLRKIEFAIDIANERRLIPVFLGDMFDRAVETDEMLKTRLIRILRKAWTLPITNTGNHDKANAVLSDGDSLAVLGETGLLKVAVHSGAVETFRIGGRLFGLGATPYGQDAPTDARPFFGKVDTIIWLTHHDVAFENPYPGSMAPFAIAGCRLVVNGHMHLRKRPVQVGKTLWINPGNITRQAIDAIDHVPAVTALTAEGKLETIPVPHEKAVFDLTGKLIDAISPGEEGRKAATEPETAESAFVNLLRADNAMEMGKTDDGSVLLEEIEEKLERDGAPEDLRMIIRSLYDAAVRQNAQR